jgi:UDPglucose 6-dehydrogenase
LRAVESVNDRQKQKLFEKSHHYFQGNLAGKTLALWGLAFKPNTDDMREASSRVLMEALWDAGAKVVAYDPVAADETRRIYQDQVDSGMLTLAGSAMTATENADALLIATEWTEFRSPDFNQLKHSLNHPVIIDGRNLFEPGLMRSLGFKYYAIGRADSLNPSL